MVEQRLIDAILIEKTDGWIDGTVVVIPKQVIYDAPTIDAVPVKVIKSWLYSIAMNNIDNSLGDACEEIILRLDGLVQYNADWKEGDSNEID